MAASSTAADNRIQVVPGSFEPQDYLDLHEDPFEVLAQLQEAWRSREQPVPWSAANLPEWDLAGVNWHSYEPPSALQRTPGVTSEDLLGIVSASIESVKARATEENQRVAREKEEAESRALAAANESKEAQKRSKENYLPIIIIDEPSPEHEAKHVDLQPSDEPHSDSKEEEDGSVVNSASSVDQAGATTTDVATRRAEAVRAVTQEAARFRALGLRKRLFQRSSHKAEASSEASGFDSWRRRLAEVHGHAKQQAKLASQAVNKSTESDDNDNLE